MREILASALEFFHPLVGLPTIQLRLRFIDDNFFALGACAVLFVSFLMWANI